MMDVKTELLSDFFSLTWNLQKPHPYRRAVPVRASEAKNPVSSPGQSSTQATAAVQDSMGSSLEDEDFSDLSGATWPESTRSAHQKADDDTPAIRVRAWAPPLPPPPEGTEVPAETYNNEVYCNDDYCIDLSGAASGPAVFEDTVSSSTDERAAGSAAALAEAEELLKSLLKEQGATAKK
jgi:hypothetical protein